MVWHRCVVSFEMVRNAIRWNGLLKAHKGNAFVIESNKKKKTVYWFDLSIYACRSPVFTCFASWWNISLAFVFLHFSKMANWCWNGRFTSISNTLSWELYDVVDFTFRCLTYCLCRGDDRRCGWNETRAGFSVTLSESIVNSTWTSVQIDIDHPLDGEFN